MVVVDGYEVATCETRQQHTDGHAPRRRCERRMEEGEEAEPVQWQKQRVMGGRGEKSDVHRVKRKRVAHDEWESFSDGTARMGCTRAHGYSLHWVQGRVEVRHAQAGSRTLRHMLSPTLMQQKMIDEGIRRRD